MKTLYSLILLSLLFFGCEKVFLGEDETNTPTNNFDLLWNDFDQHYSLFTVRNTNWDSLYSVYAPQVDETTTDDALWDTFTKLIEHLDDSHSSLHSSENTYISGYTLNKQSENEYDKSLITTDYLENRVESTTENDLSYGKLKNTNIGYVYLGSMNGSNPSVIDDVIKELENPDAIILDIRQNTGGEDRYAARIAEAFSNGRHFIYTVETRNGLNHDDFDKKKSFFTSFNANSSYTKPVMVLTDRKTISASEIFLLHMKSFDHITQIGDTTAGDFSTVSNARFLPNGWVYYYSIQKFLLPNGESLDGVGHAPDVYIKNSIDDIQNKEDKVLEKALSHLFEVYEIE